MFWRLNRSNRLFPLILLAILSGCNAENGDETLAADLPTADLVTPTETTSPSADGTIVESSATSAPLPALSPEERSDRTMFEAWIDLLGSNVFDGMSDDEEDDIRRRAAEANDYWKQIKAQNLEAIRQVNRQVIHGRSYAASIILIVADDLGYGDLGCYGQQKTKTPHLDAMAAEGVRFTNYYTGSPLGVPSRCSLTTGLHTGHTRLRGNKPVLPLKTEDCTIAELLWRAGYTTGLMGRWALGDVETTGTPNRQGFEHAFGYLDHERARNYFPPMLWRNAQQVKLPGNENGQREDYSPELTTDEALAWLNSECDRPFFLQVNYTLPHAEIGPVPEVTQYDNEDWPTAQKQYAAMVSRLDSEVGRILEFVKTSHYRDDVLIFFTSDNGPHADSVDPKFFQSAGPFRGGKGQLFEGDIRVPMIVWGEGLAEQNIESDCLWAAWDLLPTLADLAEAIRRPLNLDGISVLGKFHSRRLAERDYLYWELHEPTFQQAIRAGKWKGLRTGLSGPIALYDLENDPGETTDVAGSQAEVVERLEGLLNDARSESADWPVGSDR